MDKKARELFKQGYNCAQSVFCAYADEVGMDLETALKLSSSFGGGMGRLREVCGAVSAIFMIAGLEYGYTEFDNDEMKEAHYERIQNLAKEFEKQNGSIICRELLGLDTKHDSPKPAQRTDEYYQTRPCEELVACAAKIISEIL